MLHFVRPAFFPAEPQVTDEQKQQHAGNRHCQPYAVQTEPQRQRKQTQGQRDKSVTVNQQRRIRDFAGRLIIITGHPDHS